MQWVNLSSFYGIYFSVRKCCKFFDVLGITTKNQILLQQAMRMNLFCHYGTYGCLVCITRVRHYRVIFKTSQWILAIWSWYSYSMQMRHCVLKYAHLINIQIIALWYGKSRNTMSSSGLSKIIGRNGTGTHTAKEWGKQKYKYILSHCFVWRADLWPSPSLS